MKVRAPTPVKVELLPEHIIAGLAVTEIVGGAFVLIGKVVKEVQPAAFVPVTVYSTLAVGVITTLAPVKAPGFQV